MGYDTCLHLHRLDDAELLPHAYLLALDDGDGDECARHGRDKRARRAHACRRLHVELQLGRPLAPREYTEA